MNTTIYFVSVPPDYKDIVQNRIAKLPNSNHHRVFDTVYLVSCNLDASHLAYQMFKPVPDYSSDPIDGIVCVFSEFFGYFDSKVNDWITEQKTRDNRIEQRTFEREWSPGVPQ
ncbi:MAG: hypothetical protein F4X56_05865 [Gammaproteobacteria bacterium]|nr:hypothetical protein [Gammaproteobacteria bacterium]